MKPAIVDSVAIERETTTVAISQMAKYLSEHLGQSATAYLAGLKNPRMVSNWIKGAEPNQFTRVRIRSAYTAARMVMEAYGDETAEAWFFGSNSRLNDDAPAWILRHAESLDDLRFIVPAAKAFARASD